MSTLEELRQRWDALDTRERRFLAGGALALGLVLLYLAIWQPVWQYRERARDEVAAQRELVAWMRGAADVLQQRGGPANRTPVETGGSLLTLADTSARSAGLAQSLRRIQQDGNDGVRVRLEAASFDALILWLDGLQQRNGVMATELSVDRADGAGLVDASLTLQRNAAP